VCGGGPTIELKVWATARGHVVAVRARLLSPRPCIEAHQVFALNGGLDAGQVDVRHGGKVAREAERDGFCHAAVARGNLRQDSGVLDVERLDGHRGGEEQPRRVLEAVAVDVVFGGGAGGGQVVGWVGWCVSVGS
jgi:hypothetical protein